MTNAYERQADDTGTAPEHGDDAPGGDEISLAEVDGPVGTAPRPEPSRRRAMIEWAGGE